MTNPKARASLWEPALERAGASRLDLSPRPSATEFSYNPMTQRIFDSFETETQAPPPGWRNIFAQNPIQKIPATDTARKPALPVEKRRNLSKLAERLVRKRIITRGQYDIYKHLLFKTAYGRTGRCFPSQTEIAEKTGLSRSTVERAIKRLKECGLLAWSHRMKRIENAPNLWNRANEYHFPALDAEDLDRAETFIVAIIAARQKEARQVAPAWARRQQAQADARQVEEERQAKAEAQRRAAELDETLDAALIDQIRRSQAARRQAP